VTHKDGNIANETSAIAAAIGCRPLLPHDKLMRTASSLVGLCEHDLRAGIAAVDSLDVRFIHRRDEIAGDACVSKRADESRGVGVVYGDCLRALKRVSTCICCSPSSCEHVLIGTNTRKLRCGKRHHRGTVAVVRGSKIGWARNGMALRSGVWGLH
jgi:hypothetical protein